MKPEPISTFISYAHEDEQYKNQLMTHLKALGKDCLSLWQDRVLKPGERWDERIKLKLDEAKLVIFLISSDFLASEYIQETEVPRTLEKEQAGKVKIAPIIIRPTTLINSPLTKFKLIPKDGIAITKWDNMDEAWVNVVTEIHDLLPELQGLMSTKGQSTKLPVENILETIQGGQTDWEKLGVHLDAHIQHLERDKIIQQKTGNWLLENIDFLTDYLLANSNASLMDLLDVDRLAYRKFIKANIVSISFDLQNNLDVEFEELQEFLKRREVEINSLYKQIYQQLMDDFYQKIKEEEQKMNVPLLTILAPVIKKVKFGYSRL